MTYIAKSYAKINLGLRVLRRRDTGYHDIETGFVFINWYDRLELTKSHETLFRCSNKDLSTGDSNLVMKALNLMRKETGLPLNYRIQLSKQIPTGAGLGGGSSNAALMLRMINHMEKIGMSVTELSELGARIGADVPVFLHGQTGIGMGVGDDLLFAGIQPNAWIVTVYPGFESNTADAYRNCIPNEDEGISVNTVLSEMDIDEWKTFLVNDLEPCVIEYYPFIGNLKDQFYDMGAIYASMSGSGSCVYGIFEQEIPAIDAFEYLKLEGYLANFTLPEFKTDQGIYLKT